MDLDRLEAFVAVAAERHFGRAAERLHIAQPPLSRRIQQLERELGVVLFARDHHGVEITDAGTRLLPDAQRTLAQVRRLEALAKALRSGSGGLLRLGFVASAAAEVMPRLVAAHRRAFPALEWRLGAATSEAQVQALRAGELDAGLIRPPERRPGLALLPIAREGLSAMLPVDHLLAGRSPLQLADLQGWPLILYPRAEDPAVRDRILSACNNAGFEPRVAEESGEFAATAGLVAAGVGIALVVGTDYAGLPPSLALTPLTGDTPAWTLALAWDGASASPSVRRLVDTAKGLWPHASSGRP
jgi:DNA-binding transcriptional LysR family regulator